jgi:large conductance mechanosensitive channel
MAVGIIIGVAFGAVISSLVADVIMPPIGLLLGKVDFANLFAVLKQGATAGPYPSLAAAKAAGAVTLNFGLFINTIINFVILAFVIFLMVKGVNQLRRPKPAPAAAPTTKDCPFCYTTISIKATRCPNCTSELKV